MADIKNSTFKSKKPSRVEEHSSPFGNPNLLDRGRLNSSEAYQMNTYLNWGVFPIPTEPDPTGQDLKPSDKYTGVKSLFNNQHAISTSEYRQISHNTPLLDTPVGRRRQRNMMDCSIKALVEPEEPRGRAVYNYSDFAYCKYLNRVSNNYLITLRRFPNPCGDHIDFHYPATQTEQELNDHTPDVGRLVTWLGTPGNEMSNILKYNVKMNWDTMTADDQSSTTTLAESDSPMATIFNLTDKQYQTEVMKGYSSMSARPFIDKMLGGIPFIGKNDSDAPYTSLRDYDDQHKVFGPVDVVNKTYVRKIGLEFEQKISLTFDYEMRSYNGINGKAAMLDLLANILAVTYNSGPFYRGGHRFIGAHQSNLFANLPLFKDADNGQLTSFSALVDSFSRSLSAVGDYYTDGGKKSFKDVAKELISGLGGILLGGMLNKLGRPSRTATNSLLTDAPVGCWHLCVGNPNSPIIEVGNLVLTDATIEHYGPLGLDDFPTGLKVTVNLDHGRPRDKDNIEKMYMRGDSRIYTPMNKGIMQMFNQATELSSNRINEQFDWTGYIKKTGDEAKSDINNVLLKYFGTTNKQNIINGAMESCFGMGLKKKKEK